MRHILLVLALSPAMGLAATVGEEKRFQINALNASDFEVIQGQNMAAAEFWCAAASYIENRQGLSETTRIYVRSPRGPARTASGRKGVVFTTNGTSVPKVENGLTLKVDAVGLSRTSAVARRYCRDAFTRSTK
ncbi:hypothetical protein [Ascidiaceihabitans sp.]|uniref:hypothetical protein n=1 Tax=Ascidiaceihabitans sp. TaxID=1872644 RepID=UPI0032976E99